MCTILRIVVLRLSPLAGRFVTEGDNWINKNWPQSRFNTQPIRFLLGNSGLATTRV